MQSTGVVDLSFQGPNSTWTNNQLGDASYLERIDRVLANTNWTGAYPTSIVTHVPFTTSDYKPLLLQLECTPKTHPFS